MIAKYKRDSDDTILDIDARLRLTPNRFRLERLSPIRRVGATPASMHIVRQSDFVHGNLRGIFDSNALAALGNETL